MSITHHPRSDLLLGYAAGGMDEALAVLVASHLTLCPHCRSEVGQLEAIGGILLDALSPAPFEEDLLTYVTAEIDVADAKPPPPKPSAAAFVRPGDALHVLPQPLRRYLNGNEPVHMSALPWRRRMNFHSISLKTKGPGHARLLRVAPGETLFYHGHTGEEFVLVLAGGYQDATGRYWRGDVAAADPSLSHEPRAAQGEPCVCLVVNHGLLLPTPLLAPISRLFRRAG